MGKQCLLGMMLLYFNYFFYFEIFGASLSTVFHLQPLVYHSPCSGPSQSSKFSVGAQSVERPDG